MPATIHPLHYRIEITPYLERFQFKGNVTVLLRADAPVETATLNILELAVWQVRVKTENGWQPCVFTQDTDSETLTIEFGRPVRGEFSLEIVYEGLINDQMAGFYRSSYRLNGRTIPMAITQFQESSARRAIPCMDHPLHKAVFELSLIVPKQMTAISNTHPVSVAMVCPDERAAEPMEKKVTFAPTPRMSTYLLFFGVGEFEQTRDSSDRRVSVYHPPGLAHTAGLGKNFGRKALRYCEQYYGIAYPLKKMDLIAVADFAFGAMENWGAITFRENLLLQFPGLTSKAGTQRICEIIAHEIAHQWFGNLVTPSDWKFLWLNESFATFFGYGVVDHYHPDWSVWDQFLNLETGVALARDGLTETVAIEIPGGEHVVINSSTAPIIYNKGASIMRMIKGHIGETHYRNGVRAYLRNHSYGCARSHHLWEAFEGASGQPVTAMMQSWINQPGHPVVSVKRSRNRLELEQKRFTYLDRENDQTWMIPITIKTWDHSGRQHVSTHIMQTAADTIALPPGTAAYKLNAGQTGFFRVAYQDKDNLSALTSLAAGNKLPEADRWGLQDDLYAFARQGSLPFSAYLAHLDPCLGERAYLPLTSICDHLHQAFVVAPENGRDVIRDAGRALAEQVLASIGYTPGENEPQTTSLLRDQVLWQAVLWESSEAGAFAAEQFDRLCNGHKVHPDIVKAVMQAGAFLQGGKALDWLSRRFEQTPSEHERLNILTAFGAFRNWTHSRDALTFVLDKVPPRNRFISVAAAGMNPFNQPGLWPWYLENLSRLEAFHPLLYERVITGLWPYGGLACEPDVQAFADAYLQDHPAFKDAVELALENLSINNRMRKAMV